MKIGKVYYIAIFLEREVFLCFESKFQLSKYYNCTIMDSMEIKTKAPVKHLAGQMEGPLIANQQYRSFRSKSKDKLINGKFPSSSSYTV